MILHIIRWWRDAKIPRVWKIWWSLFSEHCIFECNLFSAFFKWHMSISDEHELFRLLSLLHVQRRNLLQFLLFLCPLLLLGELGKVTKFLDGSVVGWPDRRDLSFLELGDGNMAGNITRLPPSKTTSETVLSQSRAADQPSLRFSGRGASFTLQMSLTVPHHRPGKTPFTVGLGGTRCECGTKLDVWGHHRELARSQNDCEFVPRHRNGLARVRRETGATVWQAEFRDMNVAVPANDARAIEVMASGFVFHYVQSAVSRCGVPLQLSAQTPQNTSHTDGAASIFALEEEKERKYVELLASDGCHFVVIGMEKEAGGVLKPRSSFACWPSPTTWQRKWTRMLSISCSQAFPSSLMSSPLDVFGGANGSTEPVLVELLRSVDKLWDWSYCWLCHPHTQIRIILFHDEQRDTPNLEFSPIHVWVILAYMCVKLQMRLYVCQAPCSIWGPFWVHFGSILGSILGPFWVHLGSIWGPLWVHFGSTLGPFWVWSWSISGFQSVFRQESTFRQESMFR